MNISITIETEGLELISSGFLFAKPNEPIWMNVFLEEEETASVVVFMHNKPHPSGKSMERMASFDEKTDEWHIFESDKGELGCTLEPAPVLSYTFESDAMDVKKTIFLQLHAKKLREGLYKVEYVWLEGQPD